MSTPGRRARSAPRHETVHLRDERGLIEEVKSLSGTDTQLLGDEEVLRMILPAIRVHPEGLLPGALLPAARPGRGDPHHRPPGGNSAFPPGATAGAWAMADVQPRPSRHPVRLSARDTRPFAHRPELLAEKPFRRGHLSACLRDGIPRSWLGPYDPVAHRAFWHGLWAAGDRPVFTVPVADGLSLHVLYENAEDDAGVHYLITHPDWEHAEFLARDDGPLEGTGPVLARADRRRGTRPARRRRTAPPGDARPGPVEHRRGRGPGRRRPVLVPQSGQPRRAARLPTRPGLRRPHPASGRGAPRQHRIPRRPQPRRLPTGRLRGHTPRHRHLPPPGIPNARPRLA
ncbi:hypothetical protein Sros01_45380 [Streptomyces roseochromogenus]|nr:hypothetical protein Sros01_45380 [Streptomyces roseochromogenus]